MAIKKQKMTVGILSLGCARNLVDSQAILGQYKKKGYNLVDDVKDADIAIVNTCGFIDDAKNESIDAVLELIDLKKKKQLKKIIVAGCLSERYHESLSQEFPDIDIIQGILELERENIPPQVPLTPKHYSYIKICESCYNKCNFCIIPSIKGAFCSRSIGSILKEVKALDRRKVKELNIVGQDITAYGMDIYKEKKLSVLIKDIAGVCDNIEWIRLLYTFPAHITDELIDVIAKEDRVCKYIDLPLQHVSDKILKRMNRNIDKKGTIALINKIRSRIPDAAIRTAFIVGLPGETDAEFKELLAFVKAMKFEKMGAFKYSKEEGTKAFGMRGQVPEKVKAERLERLMAAQKNVSSSIQEAFVGRTLKVLVEEDEDKKYNIDRLKKDTDSDERVYAGRSQYDAPEVDGVVYIYSKKTLSAGKLIDVKITSSYEYDLIGEVL